jgi:hypothetical protein
VDALEDKAPMPARVWNRIPDNVRGQIVDLALEEPELSPRKLAVRFTDTKRYLVSEASVCRVRLTIRIEHRSYARRGIVEKAGWAPPLGAERPNSGLAIACEKALAATK